MQSSIKGRVHWEILPIRQVILPGRTVSDARHRATTLSLRRNSQCLSGRVKSGQRWSGQNRPTDVARDMVLLSHLLLIGQVRFGSPAPWSAFQDVTVV